jgi:adenine specific DNA methylase Mod
MTRMDARLNGGGNRLYFGDNLTVLREHVKDESVDLIYLDPPFNSDANYNVLFRSPTGQESDAQVEAFRDSWEWADAARDAYADVIDANGDVALVVSSLKKWLGENAMMAYIVMMAARLIELRRVLKPDGSLYLHCDPTASHYLKLVLDAVFGHEKARSEIIWKRTNARGTKGNWPRLHDTILMYGSENANFISQTALADKAKLPHTLITGSDGKKYQTFELTGAGVTKEGQSGLPWKGFNPSEMGRHWGNNRAQMNEWDRAGLIHWPSNGGWPRRKAAAPFDPESRRVIVGDVWTDIDRLNQTAKERLGYPTQKPLALLDRIIQASSKPGDVVLDPFCGCGTSLESAQKNGRRWIGIDVAHYAMTLIEGRLKAKYPAVDYSVYGRPTDLAGARELARRDKYQFQWWAAWKLGSQTYREDKKGADRGIDGNIYFHNGPYGVGRIVASVKGGEHVGVQMVRDLRGVIEREEAEMGVMVTLVSPTGPMLSEAASAGFVRKSAHGRLPRLQVVSVADILAGHMPTLPPLPQPERKQPAGRKRAHADQIEMIFPFGGEIIKPQEGVHVDPRFRRFG